MKNILIIGNGYIGEKVKLKLNKNIVIKILRIINKKSELVESKI